MAYPSSLSACMTRSDCEQQRLALQKANDPAWLLLACELYPVSCAGASSGSCIDVNKYNCSTTLEHGKCPGGSNILWCSGKVTAKSGGSSQPTTPTAPPSRPGTTYTEPPPGVTTAGFSPVLAVLLGLTAFGMWYSANH